MSYYADTIRACLTMRQVAEFYGLEVNRAGFISCPFHQERTASCRCYDNGFYCFGCHAHGSVIDFVMQYFGLEFMDAMRKLSDDFGLNLPIDRKPTLRDKYRTAPKPNRRLMEHSRLEKEESEAEAAWIRADNAVNSSEPMSDEFAAALKEREKAGIRWRECEVKLYGFREHNSERPAGSGNIPAGGGHTGAGGTGQNFRNPAG